MMSDDDMLDAISTQMCINNIKNDHATLLFVHSRRRTVELAQSIAFLVRETNDVENRYIQSASFCEKGVLSFCLKHGIGFHNA